MALTSSELEVLGREIQQAQSRLQEIQTLLETRCGEMSSLAYRAAESAGALQRLVWELERGARASAPSRTLSAKAGS